MDWRDFMRAPWLRVRAGEVPFNPSRRAFIGGAAAVVAAASIMPVRMPGLIAATEEDLVEVGVLPAAGPFAGELSDVIRRAFVPRLYAQLWKSAPLMDSLLRPHGRFSGALPLMPALCAHTEIVAIDRRPRDWWKT